MVYQNPFANQHTFQDYQRLQDEFDMRKAAAVQAQQLQSAQIQKIQAEIAEPDLDKLGQTAFAKASQGIPLSPVETSALKWVDAKQQSFGFNPVTGTMEQKPSLLQRAGVGQGANVAPNAQPVPQATQPNTAPSPGNLPPEKQRAAILDIYGGGEQAPQPVIGNSVPPQITPQQEMDAEFQKEYDALSNDPKAQHELRTAYAKSKFSPNEDQSKAGGFADRMAISNQTVVDKSEAGASPIQRVAAAIPLLGNFVISDDFQSFNQAQRDFINAQLRRESGAAIAPEEFSSARQQYFPQPGDSPQTVAQKERNRGIAINSMQRSAGPSYKAPPLTKDALQSEFDAKKAPVATAVNPKTGERLELRGGKWQPVQ